MRQRPSRSNSPKRLEVRSQTTLAKMCSWSPRERSVYCLLRRGRLAIFAGTYADKHGTAKSLKITHTLTRRIRLWSRLEKMTHFIKLWEDSLRPTSYAENVFLRATSRKSFTPLISRSRPWRELSRQQTSASDTSRPFKMMEMMSLISMWLSGV